MGFFFKKNAPTREWCLKKENTHSQRISCVFFKKPTILCKQLTRRPWKYNARAIQLRHCEGSPGRSRLTFTPRFDDSRIPPRYQVEENDLGAFRPGPCTEFRCGSCCDSHLSWRHHICKMLPGGVETHSKTLSAIGQTSVAANS